jgi:hypothetical protein
MLDTRKSFALLDGPLPFTLRWFPLQNLAGLEVQPVFLCHGLTQIPDRITHFVHREASYEQARIASLRQPNV